MAAWGSLKNIFENPLPDSLSSWSQLLPKAETETSFDMFGEICHRVKPESSPNYPRPPTPVPSSPKRRLDKASAWNGTMSDTDENAFEIFGELCYKTKSEPELDSPILKLGGEFDAREPEVLSPREVDDISLCTEGLGLESMGDADDLAKEGANRSRDCGKKVIYARSYSDIQTKNNRLFPPPITSIGRHGKPRVYFKSYRNGGRFVLREIRIPTQRLLHARRDDGRLRMQVVGPVEEIARSGKEKEKKRLKKEKREDEKVEVLRLQHSKSLLSPLKKRTKNMLCASSFSVLRL